MGNSQSDSMLQKAAKEKVRAKFKKFFEESETGRKYCRYLEISLKHLGEKYTANNCPVLIEEFYDIIINLKIADAEKKLKELQNNEAIEKEVRNELNKLNFDIFEHVIGSLKYNLIIKLLAATIMAERTGEKVIEATTEMQAVGSYTEPEPEQTEEWGFTHEGEAVKMEYIKPSQKQEEVEFRPLVESASTTGKGEISLFAAGCAGAKPNLLLNAILIVLIIILVIILYGEYDRSIYNYFYPTPYKIK